MGILEFLLCCCLFGENRPILCVTEKSKKRKKGNPHTDMGTPHIGMGRDMSIFQIGESPYQYGAHSNLGTNRYITPQHPHNFPDSTELTSNQSETPYTHYSFQLTSIQYIQLIIIRIHISRFVYTNSYRNEPSHES
jgi:hypothetical protein